MAENGRIHLNRVSYTNVGSIALFDATLSMRAKGLYATMTAYACIPDFKLFKKHLVNQFPEGSTAFNSAWNELINRGYLVMNKTQDGSGKYIYTYSIQDTPVEVPEENQRKIKRVRTKKKPEMEKPHMDKPEVEKPDVVKPPLKVNTEKNNTKERFIELSETADDPCDRYEQMRIVEEDFSVPSEVKQHEDFSVMKILNATKDKNGNQFKNDQLIEILCTASRRYKKQAEADVIGNPWKYYLRVVKSVASQWENIKRREKRQIDKLLKNAKQQSPNRFHNFHQREYDYDQLEKDLLSAQW